MSISERLIRDGRLVVDRNNARRASSNAIYRQAGLAAQVENDANWLAVIDANNARRMSSNGIFKMAKLAAQERSTVNDLLAEVATHQVIDLRDRVSA